MSSFEISGLEELQLDLESAIAQFPKEAKNSLKRCGTKFVQDVRKNAAEYPEVVKSKNWRKDYQKAFNPYIEIINKHPLHHLLENGHVKVLWGKRTNGFVKGKHYTERARQEWEGSGKLAEELDKTLAKMIKDNNL